MGEVLIPVDQGQLNEMTLTWLTMTMSRHADARDENHRVWPWLISKAPCSGRATFDLCASRELCSPLGHPSLGARGMSRVSPTGWRHGQGLVRERERDLREDATTGVEGELRRNALWRFGDW